MRSKVSSGGHTSRMGCWVTSAAFYATALRYFPTYERCYEGICSLHPVYSNTSNVHRNAILLNALNNRPHLPQTTPAVRLLNANAANVTQS